MKSFSAKQQALKLLAYRRYFSFEIREKLRQKGYNPSDIEAAVVECQKLGYVNDEEDLIHFIEKEYKKGHGPLFISAKLKAKKGWSKESQVLVNRLRSKQEEAIAAFIQKHAKRYQNDKVKLFQALARRGFERESIAKFLD